MRNADPSKGGTLLTERMIETQSDQKTEFDKRKYLREKREQEFKSSFKNIDNILVDQDIKIPEIIYLANKTENGFEGDVLSDFYKMFPNAANEFDADGRPIEPLFISAEHGDGLTDLYQALRRRIPDNQFTDFEARKRKRVERYH